MEWGAIGYVTSGLTLAALVVLAVADVLRKRISKDADEIAKAPDADRAALIARAQEKYALEPIRTSKLDGTQVVELALEQLRERRRRLTAILVTAVVIAAMGAGVSVHAMGRDKGGTSTPPAGSAADAGGAAVVPRDAGAIDAGPAEKPATVTDPREVLRRLSSVTSAPEGPPERPLDAVPPGAFAFISAVELKKEKARTVTVNDRASLFEIHRRSLNEIVLLGYVAAETVAKLHAGEPMPEGFMVASRAVAPYLKLVELDLGVWRPLPATKSLPGSDGALVGAIVLGPSAKRSAPRPAPPRARPEPGGPPTPVVPDRECLFGWANGVTTTQRRQRIVEAIDPAQACAAICLQNKFASNCRLKP